FPPGRRELIRHQKARRLGARPFIVLGVIILLGLAAVPAYAFVQSYVFPPREVAVRVEDVTYTRGDVVDFIRFNQRITEDLGVEFQLGTSLFEALQTIADNEISYQVAPRLGISVDPAEVDRTIESLLGFNLTDEERRSPEVQSNIAERKRQFLNEVGLNEETYREIVRKDTFKQRVRSYVADSVPLIQPQARVYEIVLSSPDVQVLQRIERRLSGGASAEDVALEFSEDPDVRRDRGDRGWVPQNVVLEIDNLLFGQREDGSRVLPIGVPSDPIFDSNGGFYNVYVVTEFTEAREVDPEPFETLTDRALTRFLNEERQELDVFVALNDRVYNWVNEQVRLASLRPTPTPPGPQFPGLPQ
ncbi:MAG: peptidylprolyl isomerase, partial [Dehalococcoidia bacterium]